MTVFNQVAAGKQPKWHLRGIPEIQFYRELHLFLKKWHVSSKSTRQTIGRFYISIDPTLQARGIRPDNVYRLIERISLSTHPPNSIMSYGSDTSVAKAVRGSDESIVKAVRMEARACTEHLETLDSEYGQLRKKFEESQKQLSSARKALRNITNEKLQLQKQCYAAKTKATELRHECEVLEDNFSQLEEDNIELSSAILDLRSELESIPDKSSSSDCDGDFSLPTKQRRRYSPAVVDTFLYLINLVYIT